VAEVRAVFTGCLVIVLCGLGYVITIGLLHR
jgi:hypothetical protein